MSQIVCPNCSAPNPTTAHFCVRCGAQLSAQHGCPYCGYPNNPADASHCAGCGRQLVTTQLPAKRVPTAVWVAAGILGALLVFSATCLLGVLAPIGLISPFARSGKPADTSGQMTEIRSNATIQVQDDSESPGKSAANATATPTASPEETPTAAPTATDQPSPTPPPTSTPVPTDTPTPSPTPCGVAVYSGFSAAWRSFEQQLSCPVAPAGQGVWMAEELFQNGRMFWREDNDKIYVLYNSGRWARYDNIWRESDPTYTCGTQSSPPTPLRGFGKIWCTHDQVRQALGNATTAEAGQHGTVQDFSGGSILRTGSSVTYVLLSSGTWQRY